MILFLFSPQKAKPAAIVPPRIIQEPKSVTVMESQPVQLIALIEGTPSK